MFRLIIAALFATVLLSPFTYAYNPLNGEFVVSESCPAWLSFKKQTNPGDRYAEKNQRYKVLGENKPGGEWLQIRLDDGSQRWVKKNCGQFVLTPLSDAPKNTGNQSLFKSKVDYYTLALTWYPAFCANTGKSRLECLHKTENFVLHGLWPSAKNKPHPAFCNGSVKKAACDYLPLGLRPQQLESLKKVMPGVQACMQRYQWHKHGVCSGMPVSEYFSQAERYVLWFRQSSVARQFDDFAGKEVSLEQVLAWLKDWGVPGGVSLHCNTLNDKPAFKELRLYLKADLPVQPDIKATIPAPRSHECPSRFFLPEMSLKQDSKRKN